MASGRGLKLHTGEHFGERKSDLEGGEFYGGIWSHGRAVFPFEFGFPNVLFNSRRFLADEQVRREGWYLAVMFEFDATVVKFGRRREHLSDESRIRQCVGRAVDQFRRAANYGNIRIGEQAGGFDFDAQVSISNEATSLQKTPEMPN